MFSISKEVRERKNKEILITRRNKGLAEQKNTNRDSLTLVLVPLGESAVYFPCTSSTWCNSFHLSLQ